MIHVQADCRNLGAGREDPGRQGERRRLARVSGGYREAASRRSVSNMWTTIVVLLIAWAVLSVIGFAFEGLLWLGVIGVILFFGTIVFGLVRRGRGQRSANE